MEKKRVKRLWDMIKGWCGEGRRGGEWEEWKKGGEWSEWEVERPRNG